MTDYGEYIVSMYCAQSGVKCERIVRCRDCIYYELDPDPIDPGWPMMCERTGADMVEPYGYCAWAERKEGGE